MLTISVLDILILLCIVLIIYLIIVCRKLLNFIERLNLFMDLSSEPLVNTITNIEELSKSTNSVYSLLISKIVQLFK